MLKELFIELVQNYNADDEKAYELWEELALNYSDKKRHYHTLVHLENLLPHLMAVKPFIKNWNTILFSFYYHDVIYHALKRTNEEKSAEYAAYRMNVIKVPEEIIEKCTQQILATKNHHLSVDDDTNYFTDADLSILGADEMEYNNYYNNIRKEYHLYTDFIYNPGRKRVLQNFLQMERIYKTDYFFAKFEEKARKNLQRELDGL